MSELITHTARLVPYTKRPKQVPSFVTAYSHEPLPDEPGAALGNLYVVIEVLVSGRSSEDVADLVIEALGDHYYNQAHASLNPLARFESAIKATNAALIEYVNQGNAAWIGKMSAVAAIQLQSELHVAQTGSAEAFLYRGKAAARICGERSESRPATPSKTFGTIASGEFEAGDRLLLATPALVHQISLDKLHGIISNTSPNTAIAEITELLRGGSTERIAALIIEATTPELAALQVRSEQPSEIQLGTPENALEAAKLAAEPLAQVTLNSSRRLGASTQSGWRRLKPHARRGSLAVTDSLRQMLSAKGGRKRLIIGGLLGLLLAIAVLVYAVGQAQTQALIKRFEASYKQYVLADAAADRGNKDQASEMLMKLQADLSLLSLAAGRSKLDAHLGNSKTSSASSLPSVAALSELVANRLDEIQGLLRVATTTVVAFDTTQYEQPKHLEYAYGKAYITGSGNNPAIYVVNTTSSSIKKSSAETSKMGKVVATALTTNSDGMLLLTEQPSVWLYRFDNDTLTQQSISLGSWPTGRDIASYGGNIYILSNDAIYKHTRTYSGYSPKSAYVTAAQSDSIRSSRALAVDGSVYTTSDSGLRQFLASTLKQTLAPTAGVGTINQLQSISKGNFILGVADAKPRIAIWNSNGLLQFHSQISLIGAKAVFGTAYDERSQTGFALVDERLVRFKLAL